MTKNADIYPEYDDSPDAPLPPWGPIPAPAAPYTRLIEYIKTKSITDTSMAMAYKMLQENVGQAEPCILALFQALYESNQELAAELLKHRSQKRIVFGT